MTLHFYSPSEYNYEYNYIRKTFLKILLATLRDWLKTVNYNPGISKEALETVSHLVENSKKQDKKLYFNLTIDEMSIRKQMLWDKYSKKFEGCVDLGKRDCALNDNSPEATNIIVFMLVCINKI